MHQGMVGFQLPYNFEGKHMNYYNRGVYYTDVLHEWNTCIKHESAMHVILRM